METVRIQKLVHGGQGLGTLTDGRKIFVWNALPGETVRARIIKKKRSYVEAIAEEIIEASSERIAPVEENYLATSPWQIMTFAAENKYKKTIVQGLFQQAGVKFNVVMDIVAASGKAARDDEFISSPGAMENPLGVFHYRNKMEYSFWGDEDGLHLALHQRGSHGKQIVSGSRLAMPAIDTAANAVLSKLQKQNVRAGDLKTVIVRTSQNGEVAASLFVKPERFPKLALPATLKGLRVYHSNPKSPASVPTKLLYELGDCTLQNTLLDKSFTYDVDSFFQVNVPVFEQALPLIKTHANESNVVDMYAGVGSIGLSVAANSVQLVELDPATAAMARLNAANSDLQVEVIEASTEKALEYITSDTQVIFDPPRAGLHKKVIEQLVEMKPPKIIYLSCNPATQARDIALLQNVYEIKGFETFNFFPRTPHIETLAMLELLQ